MMLQLSEIVTDLETWSTGRAVILCGANDSFCSGGDLALMKAIANPDEGMAMSRFMHNVIKKFCSLPLISVAVVQGQALGGGAELCVTCDFRLMSHSAVIGFVQSKLGVSPGWGGGVALTRLIGQHRALQLLITGRIMNSTECMTIGLIDDTVSDGAKGLSEAKTWLSQMLPSSSAVIHAAKRTVLNASYSHRSLEDLLRKENEILSTVWGGPAHLAALKAVKKHKK